MKHKNKYLDKEQFKNLIILWSLSALEVEERIVSEELGRMMISLCDHILLHNNFRRYDAELKEDMKSNGILRLIKNLKNFKTTMTSLQYFNYATLCVFHAYIAILKKHYKHQNLIKELKLREQERMRNEFGIDIPIDEE